MNGRSVASYIAAGVAIPFPYSGLALALLSNTMLITWIGRWCSTSLSSKEMLLQRMVCSQGLCFLN